MRHSDPSFQILLRTIEKPEVNVWLLLSDYLNRTFAGNDGYQDEIEHAYVWDSTVPNHSKIQQGDVVFVWDKQQMIGAAVIENIKVHTEHKNRYRCPQCGSTKIKKRTTKLPEFACGDQSCRHEFGQPRSERIAITGYEAEYGSTWTWLIETLDAAGCRLLASRQKSQHSMRIADKDRITRYLRSIK